MEDAHSIIVPFGGVRGQGFFAIFDGHAGKQAAEWCGQNFALVRGSRSTSLSNLNHLSSRPTSVSPSRDARRPVRDNSRYPQPDFSRCRHESLTTVGGVGWKDAFRMHGRYCVPSA